VVVGIVAAAAGVVVWFQVPDRGSTKASNATSNTSSVSARSLRELTAVLRRTVYWAGPKRGVTYEFMETSDHRVYVRYLPAGVHAGSPNPYLTVASYPVANALSATRVASKQAGATTLPVGSGGVAFYLKRRPTNVYLAYPNAAVQIEVFDPSAAVMHRLVAAGRIRPVNAATNAVEVTMRPTRTSPGGLHQLAARLRRPVYWVGSIPGRTLELTRPPDGRVYVRYIPAAVAPGSRQPYLTVATYPDAGAFLATKAKAQQPGAVKIPLPGGAIAFYSKTHPTSVYVAFPGVGEQVEVYDPSAVNAYELVATKLQPVP
jgi:hypothetical protein